MFNDTTGLRVPHKATLKRSEWWDNGALPLWITAQNQVNLLLWQAYCEQILTGNDFEIKIKINYLIIYSINFSNWHSQTLLMFFFHWNDLFILFLSYHLCIWGFYVISYVVKLIFLALFYCYVCYHDGVLYVCAPYIHYIVFNSACGKAACD